MIGSYFCLHGERRKISLSYKSIWKTHITLHSASTETLARLKVVHSTWRTKCSVKRYYYLLMKSLRFEYKSLNSFEYHNIIIDRDSRTSI